LKRKTRVLRVVMLDHNVNDSKDRTEQNRRVKISWIFMYAYVGTYYES